MSCGIVSFTEHSATAVTGVKNLNPVEQDDLALPGCI